MELTGFRPREQKNSGADGVRLLAERTSDARQVILHVLRQAAVDPVRWSELTRHLNRVKLLSHPGAIPLLELHLLGDTPFVVAAGAELKSLAEPGEGRPWELDRAMRLGHALANALSAAHRLGLCHGRLELDDVWTRGGDDWQLDFSGCRTKTRHEQGADGNDSPPEEAGGRPGTPAGDIFRLARLLSQLAAPAPPTDPAPQSVHSLDAPRPPVVSPVERPPLLPGVSQTVQALVALGNREGAAFDRLLREMLSPDPDLRPAAREVGERLNSLLNRTIGPAELANTADIGIGGSAVAASLLPLGAHDVAASRTSLGRFKLLEKLGQGGMGAVYRGEDPTDGQQVAIKILRADFAQRRDALLRFQREARLLADVRSPYVANLLEINEDDGIHYLVLELVAGRGLNELLESSGRLSEPHAVAIIADVSRALADAHERGIVHRDIKPENILLVSPPVPNGRASDSVGWTADSDRAAANLAPRVKLADFGLARHVVESESLSVTQAGSILGTPLYMAPEQSTGRGELGPAVDVYALGATLFHLLAGRPPFEGPTPMAVIARHWNEPPPDLGQVNPDVSEAVCLIVARCLAKAPSERYANAGDLLEDLLSVLRGEPTSIALHPSLPKSDKKILDFNFGWDLEATPAQLWPYVSNTERLNRAIGLPPAQFDARPESGGGVRRFAQFRAAGMQLAWEEHPFEWIEGRRMGVLREFSKGPFKWFVSTVELTPLAGGGTRLNHRLRVAPNGLLGRTVANLQMGKKAKKSLERVYRRIDGSLTGKLTDPGASDPFEAVRPLKPAQQRLLENRLDALAKLAIPPLVLERLGDYLAMAPPQEVARMRPIALARRWGLDENQVVHACLHAAREGLLQLLWDILCPVCRIPTQIKETLKALGSHGACAACNLDFELDFGNSVEMVFRVHPEIRHCELATYCIGGPAHSPHVAAQVRVAAGERFDLDLQLGEGAYRLRGPQLPYSVDFRVTPSSLTSRWELVLSQGLEAGMPRSLKPQGQRLVLVNDRDREVLVRVERTAPRADALTAARASAMSLFRQLFPGELLSPGQLVSVATVTFLVTNLAEGSALYRELGDSNAFALVHDHFRRLEERIAHWGGAVVKSVGEGLVCVFHDSLPAMQAGLELHGELDAALNTRDLGLRVGIHRGPAMAATLNEHLDYFGTTVSQAMQLPGKLSARQVGWTSSVASDPGVEEFLSEKNLASELVMFDLAGSELGWGQRLTQ